MWHPFILASCDVLRHRRVNAVFATDEQEAKAIELIGASAGDPLNIFMELNKMAKANKAHRHPDGGGRYMGVPSLAQIAEWKKNKARGNKKKKTADPSDLGSPGGGSDGPQGGQSVDSFGSPKESFTCVAELRNYAHRIRLPAHLADMQRDRMYADAIS